jgi:hypothetical protein
MEANSAAFLRCSTPYAGHDLRFSHASIGGCWHRDTAVCGRLASRWSPRGHPKTF